MTSKRRLEDTNNRSTNIAESIGPTSSHTIATATGISSAAIFNNSENILVTGGSFNITTHTTIKTGNGQSLDALHKRVAPNAILNAGGRVDEVRCHPGTRSEVIGRIERWRMEAQDSLAPPIFWLSGPAGSGKSAIVQTVAEGWKKEGVPQANFFFFRTDLSRNSVPPLIATLAHQIVLIYPPVRDSVETLLSTNPLILDCSVEEQLAELIIHPLRALQMSSSSYRPPVLLIDGLDECDCEMKHSQRRILLAFDKVLGEYPTCVCFLLASRDESQIQGTFNQISTPFVPLYLDDKFSPESDIRIIVNNQFKKIRRTHPEAHTLDDTWPSIQNVNDIAMKSSDSFYFLSNTFNYLECSSASPMLSLERLQNVAARANTKSPFPLSDAVYSQVLSQAADQEALKDVLRTQLLIRHAFIVWKESNEDPISLLDHRHPEGVPLLPLLTMYHSRYTRVVVRSCLADLTSIVRYTDDDHLLFHHASFPDYLLDQTRSGQYFVDLDKFNFQVLSAVWKCLDTAQYMYVVAYSGLSRLKELPPGFLDILAALNPCTLADFGVLWEDALAKIHSLCTRDDDFVSYAQIIRQWVGVSQFVVYNELSNVSRPLCIRRYFMILCLEEDATNWPPAADVRITLAPVTDSDIHETTIWLNDSLDRLHKDLYKDPNRKRRYKPILKRYISYAVSTNMPLNTLRLDNFLGSRWYLWVGKVKQWISRLNPREGK